MSTSVVIGIPTFRRPGLLRVLLQSLVAEVRGTAVTVIVADNDCGAEAPAVVAELVSQGLPAVCIPVRERGLAAVRNALVHTATERHPDWRWLVMLDDDGAATPGWLQALLATGDALGAHLVGGPIDGDLPPGASILARNSIFARRRRWPTGRVETLNTTQNLAIARDTVRLLGLPLFRNEFGRSGGEDYDLFCRVAQAGGVLAWCNEAVIAEPTPAERLTVRALLHRYATTGAYMALIDRERAGVPRSWLVALKGLAGSIVRVAWNVLRMRWDDSAHAFLGIAHYAGRIGGLLGTRTSRYVSKESSA